MDLGAFSVSLSVKDIEVSKVFYEKLGFSVFMGQADEGWLIMKNGNAVIGLIDSIKDNMLTFNPGWDQNGNDVEHFADIREIQQRLQNEGVTLDQLADPRGPASILLTDPDGNRILIDQHVF